MVRRQKASSATLPFLQYDTEGGDPVRHINTGIKQRLQPVKDLRSASGGSLAEMVDGFSSHGEAPIHLHDQASLAELLCISKKTVQNLYSRTPHLLPPAIDIPGARGPRWTAPSIIAWLEGRPAHTSMPAPVMAKRSVGRPRIAAQ